VTNYGKFVPEHDRRDLRRRLLAELQDWSNRQSKDIYADFHLYYQARSPEHDGGFMFCSEKPVNDSYQLGWPERVNKGATIEQNYNYFLPILRNLPIGSDWR
jgi:hypothetical protein